jgi:hypothetical protein
MAPRTSLKTLASRRRRADGDEDEESVTGVDDSQSEASVASDLDNTADTLDADADASESSDADSIVPLPVDKTVAQSVGPAKTGRTRSKKSKGTKTDRPSSNLNNDELVKQESVTGESEVSANAAGAPIVSSESGPARRGETVADRRRREHDDYRKKRDTDPTFIPNRGNFFMHDARTTDQRGFGSYGRGRGRGRGIPQAPSRYVCVNPAKSTVILTSITVMCHRQSERLMRYGHTISMRRSTNAVVRLSANDHRKVLATTPITSLEAHSQSNKNR